MPPATDTRHKNPELEDALSRIYGLHRKEMDFRLDKGPYIDLLAKLGNPQDKLPPTIHVAGTNGKGSTIAQMRAQLECLGKSVHVYTSPHLFEFNERLRIASKLITDDQLLTEIDYIFALNGTAPITFFEFTSALMFHLFAKYPADYALIEVGMGGRLDCTNVIKKPTLTIITSIGYDHQAFLGETIEEIAREKAGIIKNNVPCVIAPQAYRTVLPTVKAIADQKIAPLINVARNGFIIPHMHGAHQIDNASTANKALETLIPHFNWNNDIKPQWRGRFQKLNADFDFYYDGAHNIDSLKALSQTISTTFPDRGVSFIFAMQPHKNPAMIKQALGHFDAPTYIVLLNTEQTTQNMTSSFKNADITITSAFDDMGDAIKTAHFDNPKNVIIVAGSLYAAQLIPNEFWRKL